MYQNSDCPIWGIPSYSIDQTEYTIYGQIDSPRSGGKYYVDKVTSKLLSSISDETRARLTDWLVEERRLGNTEPEITEKDIERAKTASSPSVIEKADRLLKYLEKNSNLPGIPTQREVENMSMSHEYLLAIIGSTNPGDYRERANPGSESWMPELKLYFNYLEKKGWITPLFKGTMMEFTVEFEGYAHLESLQSKTDSKQAFVAMWFDDSMDEAYDNGIKPAIEEAGYDPNRIKDIQFNNEINDRIIAEIRRSRFVVADFTHDEKGQRGGVYFEAGLAKGMGLEVIYTCREDLHNEIHFDTQQFNHIFWNSSEDLKRKLKYRIGHTIGDGPLYNQKN